jgi:hypothetical protein
VVLAVVAFLAFAGGAALFTVRDRLGSSSDARVETALPAATVPSELTPPGILATLAAQGTLTPEAPPGVTTLAPPTPDLPATAVAMATATAQARVSASPAPPTAAPTLAPTATPCPIAAGPGFAGAWQQMAFGCPTTEPRTVWAAVEPFERGSMLWRSDSNRSYLFTTDGQWEVINAAWDGQPPPGRGDPPPGLLAPERGFGWAWSTIDPIFQRLGWATDIEKGFCAQVQEYQGGFLLLSAPIESCTEEGLYNQATAGDWRPVALGALESGLWAGSLAGPEVAAPAPTRTVSVAARPEENGVFTARSPAGLSQPIVVDGALADWPATGWMPITSPVEGNDRYAGAQDASALFNLIWSQQGLMLAVRATDDVWRPGPIGTDLWQGDALELHLDTRLAEDYSDPVANRDDFQIGIAPTGNGSALQLYRWLPLEIEGPQPAAGQAIAGNGGYTLEVLLPWSLFLLDPPQAGASFGFNLSMSDNDSNTQSQESVISASPARTTFDNPGEWGTLVLLP